MRNGELRARAPRSANTYWHGARKAGARTPEVVMKGYRLIVAAALGLGMGLAHCDPGSSDFSSDVDDGSAYGAGPGGGSKDGASETATGIDDAGDSGSTGGDDDGSGGSDSGQLDVGGG